MRSVCCVFAVAGLAMLSSRPVEGDEVTIIPDRDNTLFESSAGLLSNGAGPSIFAGKTNFSELLRRGLVRFDVAGAVPAGSTITGVSLTLFCSQASPGNRVMTLHRVSADWGEGASNAGLPGGGGATAEPGDATWLHRFYDTATWAAPGGDFAAAASGSATVGGAGTTATWSSTPAMVADAQAWLDSPATNFGWAILGEETTPNTAKRFESRENPIEANRPMLRLTFTPPAGGCYANCDASTTAPILNVNDFVCFLNKFGAGDAYANCDASTVAPVLNVNDFTCFLNKFAAGCP
ncbi:MAG: DNRLRE domain-containing protein [Phycisphaerae bacterium]|nr:DNRLRE domain-containing protein [Phycisphaerae bacterium]